MLRVEGLVKDFGGQRALDGVDFEVRPGEVHALLGENGAGKSTLIRILAGVLRPDAGTVEVEGARFVHQDLGLVDELSVAENIALELGYSSERGLVSMRRTERRAAELTARQGVEIDPRRLVGALPQAEKVMVAIARAFSVDARVIVLDEVSASLPAPQVVRLQAAVRRAAATGVAFVWVTHRLDELAGFADRLTVLRDGRRVVCAEAGVPLSRIVEWIVGRPVAAAPRSRAAATAAALSVRGLRGPGLAAPVDLDVAAGEVLGLTGLIGSGAQPLARLLGGSPRVRGGQATLSGSALPLGRPRAMRRAGCGYVPGDRARDGGFGALTVRENLFPTSRTLPRRERAAAQALVQAYGVRPGAASELPLDSLSGGNQQKVVFARALRGAPPLLVLADPTTGVDVGAREELYALVRAAAAEGAAVVLASSDFEEIVNQADRALVLVRGRVAAELAGDGLTRDALAAASYGAQA